VAIAIRNEGAKINSTINVTPMVDVMLVLLIIFMVVTPMIHGAHVKMPQVDNSILMQDADREDALIVSVMRDGKIFFDTQAVTNEELTQKIKDRLPGVTNKTIFVRADARVHYRVVVNAVDDVRSAGGDQLGLLTERKMR
jgi:biopolymer transport protein ExbD/biopolymer transport protein TolR